MNELHLPWLELAVFIPLVGAFTAWNSEPDRARRVALATSVAALACAVAAWFDLAFIHSFAAHDRISMLGWLPGGDPLVIDELSAPLILLTALQFSLLILATLRTKSRRFSFALTLLSESIVLATFAVKSPWALSALLVTAIVPPVVEIRRRGESARIFLLHMAMFSALLVAGILLGGAPQEGQRAALTGSVLIAAAVLIRSGVVPFQLWMIDLYQRASFGTAILFVTPMTGAYAALRLLLPSAPDVVLTAVAAASLCTAIYAAGMALVVSNVRRFFTFLVLSQGSLVLVGLEIATLLGLTGALCVWVSVGLAMTGFGLTLRCIEGRVGHISFDRYHGLYNAAPSLAGLCLLTGLASIGFPGTIGFIALEVLIEGAAHSSPMVGVLGLVATALCGLAVLHAYFRIFAGAEHVGTIDLRIRPPEQLAVVVLALLILGGGLAPQPGLSSRRHAAEALLNQRAATVGVENRPTTNEPSAPVVASEILATRRAEPLRRPAPILDGTINL